jgi:NDP-sugar pyrophosphorylase family protein
VRAILLCAGRGVRFRPVTERIPKPLVPFLNVPVAISHLRRLHDAGIREVAINLHHLGDEVERHLRDQAAQLPQLTFFHEPRLLGTAGALRNASSFLGTGDFLVVNSDAAIEPDFSALITRHRESGRAATLLVTENRDPDHYTPLQSEGDRITAFGVHEARPLLYTGVCALAPRVLGRIPAGETALVADLWQPLLEGRGGPTEELGFLFHHGPHADLGRPDDFLRATLEALDRGGPFPRGSGSFDDRSGVLAQTGVRSLAAHRCVLGRATIGADVSIRDSAIWDGTVVGDGAVLDRCILASGRVAPGAKHEKALLWADRLGDAAVARLIDV